MYPSEYPDGELDTVRESGPPPTWPDAAEIERHQSVSGGCTATTLSHDGNNHVAEPDDDRWDAPSGISSRGDVETLVDRYDAQIQHVDSAVGRLLAELERAGVREETTVVVTADHGEAFGEHGIYATHGFPDPAVQNVPMIVSGPPVADAAAGDRRSEYVYQFDLIPTLCALADVPVPAGWDGESFLPALEGERFAGRDHLVCGNGVLSHGRAVYSDGWAYIRLLHPGVYAFPGLYADGEVGLELLHDLEDDPHMTENLIGERPAVADSLRAILDRTTSEWVLTVDTQGTDPLVRAALEDGPFLYNDPAGLARAYEDAGTPDDVVAPIREARKRGPIGE